MRFPTHQGARPVWDTWARANGWRSERPSAPNFAALIRGVTFPPSTSGQVAFGGTREAIGGHAAPLASYDEQSLVALLVTMPGVLGLIQGPLGEIARRRFPETKFDQLWSVVGLRREDLRLDAGRPGDFDLVVGPSKDGAPLFDWIVGVEVKRRATLPDGSPGRPRSGLGTDQANALTRSGCDLGVLLLLCPASTRPETWTPGHHRPPLFSPDSSRTIDATWNLVRSRLEPHVGFLALSWTHAPGTSPRAHSEAEIAALRPPELTLARPTNRSAMLTGLRRTWGGRLSYGRHYCLIRCFLPGCQQVVPLLGGAYCPACKRPWFPWEDLPGPLNARPSVHR